MTELRRQVREFHAAMSIPDRETPGLCDAATIRLRARLVLEEAFEFAEALFSQEDAEELGDLKAATMSLLERAEPAVNLPDAADALADIDYVVEGSRLQLGVDGTPIARAVHAANMAKLGGPKDEHGKQQKPPGWTPPDIAAELRKQGWSP